jgi:hypothetical protein
MKLATKERASVAAKLLRSIDHDDEELTPKKWEAQWTEEIGRRVQDIQSGKAKLIDGDEALAHVRTTLKPSRK